MKLNKIVEKINKALVELTELKLKLEKEHISDPEITDMDTKITSDLLDSNGLYKELMELVKSRLTDCGHTKRKDKDRYLTEGIPTETDEEYLKKLFRHLLRVWENAYLQELFNKAGDDIALEEETHMWMPTGNYESDKDNLAAAICAINMLLVSI
jgi:hypothetical protein